MFKKCGTCSLCCEGWLFANAYGNVFGKGKACVFLCHKQCVIYETKPETCTKFQCGWTQHLFPDWMYPLESDVIVSIEFDENKKQYLKVMEVNHSIRDDVKSYLDEWVSLNNTYYKIVKYNEF